MEIVLGLAAIIFAVLNIGFSLKKKNAELYRYLSLSFTALTVCAFYSSAARDVAEKDWSALMDTVPTISTALWVLVLISILINSVSLFKGNKQALAFVGAFFVEKISFFIELIFILQNKWGSNIGYIYFRETKNLIIYRQIS